MELARYDDARAHSNGTHDSELQDAIPTPGCDPLAFAVAICPGCRGRRVLLALAMNRNDDAALRRSKLFCSGAIEDAK